MRLFAAICVLAVALPAALFLHQRLVSDVYTLTRPAVCYAEKGLFDQAACLDYTKQHGEPPVETYYTGRITRHPAWEDPVSLLVALGGIAVAAGVLATERREYVGA